jgi:dTDP-4-amino-4,6-dideoxygalactose transaminase
VDVGSSYLPSDLLAAFLFAQLEAREHIQASRRRVWEYYYEHLQNWAVKHDARLPFVPDHCEQSYHMFYLLLPTLEHRRRLINHLRSNGIESVFHYLPLHLSDMGKRFGGKEGECSVTEHVTDCLLRLPFFNELTEVQQQGVISAIKSFTY